MKKAVLLLVGSAIVVLGGFVGQMTTTSTSSNLQRESIDLAIVYDDGSQKSFSFDDANSLFDLFQLAAATKAGLETMVWPDRGEIRILAFQIDGHGHPSPGKWTLTRNGIDFWPDMSQFTDGPLNGGDSIVFTLEPNS